MMRKLFLGVCLMVAVSLQAQKIIKGQTGEIILDCSDLDASFVETVKGKKCMAGTPSNATYRDGSTTINPYASENDKVYVKLEIDKSHFGNSDWATAYNNCKNKGAGWRLPTQRELMLILILREAIEKCGGVAFPDYYWSATERNNNNSWEIMCQYNVVNSEFKNTSYIKARCVKEL